MRWLAWVREDGGSALVETALVMPVLTMMLVGGVDLGHAWSVAIAAESAAHAGAMYGSQHPTDTAGMISAGRTDAADWGAVTVTASYDCRCSDGTSVQANCSSEPVGCAANSVYNVQVVATAAAAPVLQAVGMPTFQVRRAVSLRAAR